MSDLSNILKILDNANTIPELLSYAAGRFQNQVAVKAKMKDKIIEKTFVQLKDDSDALSAKLEEMGFVQEKVAVIGGLCYEWLVTYFGVTGSGNIVVSIDKDLNPVDIEKLVLQADVSALFIDDSRLDLALHLGKQCSSIKRIVCFQSTDRFEGLFAFISKRCYDRPQKIPVPPGQTAMIVFTSGDAGDTKGAMLSHKNICHNVICSAYLLGKNLLRPGECTVPVLPVHHMFGITSSILTLTLYYGGTLCISGGLNDYFKSLKQFRPTVLVMVPMIVEGIYKKIWREAKKNGLEDRLIFRIKLSRFLLKLKIDIRRFLFREVLESLGGNLRVISCGGAFMDPSLVDKFRDFGITLLNGYGITECSPVVSSNRPNGMKRNSVGLVAPEPYCQVKIDNGEIMIKGSIVASGYYKDPVNTSKTFDGAWFKTGDLGYLDKDNYLYITGRKKDLIILKDGNNISPVEIEMTLEQHPLVDSAFVYAAKKNLSETLVAAIHPNAKYAAENHIDDIKSALDAIVDSINKLSPAFKRIRMVEVVEDSFDKSVLKKEKRNKFQ